MTKSSKADVTYHYDGDSGEYSGFTIILRVKPVPASRPRVSRWGTYYLKTYKTYKDAAHAAIPVCTEEQLDCALGCTIEFICHAPKKITLVSPRGDIDNHMKAILDGIVGLAATSKQECRLKKYIKDDEIISHADVSNWKERKETSRIVVHCSATPETMDIGVEEIRKWHRQRGWLDVGYHKIIRRDGTIEDGRPLTAPGAHARGFNHTSVGICLIGGVESDVKKPESNYTHAQWESLEDITRDMLFMYPEAVVVGHRDLPNVNKACPSFDVLSWWQSRNT